MKRQLFLFLGVVIFLIPAQNVKAQNPPPLFKAAEGPIAFGGEQEKSTVTGGISVKRSRLVQIELPLIDRKAADKVPKSFGEGPLDSLETVNRIQLNLFDDVSFVAALKRVSISTDGKTVTWIGILEGLKESQVSLAATDGSVSGNVSIRFAQVRLKKEIHISLRGSRRPFLKSRNPLSQNLADLTPLTLPLIRTTVQSSMFW